MFKNIYPLFERKRLLKIEMLSNMRDFPRELFQVFYQEYHTGIVKGADLKVTDDCLVISPGILYWNKMPYVMGEPVNIPYEANEKISYLKVRFLEDMQGSEKKEYLTQIYVNSTPPEPMNEMELCRFKLQTGARLRNQYTDFYDYDTEFDTLNRIHVPYASPSKNTIWPEILKSFAKTLMEYSSNNNPWDCSFCLNCLQLEQGMNYEELKGYLNKRLKEKRNYHSNHEIYVALKKILELERNGTTYHQTQKGERKIMLL
jgi:hypothetical protein